MIQRDTIRLLRECDAGIKMGVASIDDVLHRVRSKGLQEALDRCKDEHEDLEQEIRGLLNKYQDQGKKPNAMAKAMAHMKTCVKMGVHDSDATAADLITDGCNMGIKSLSKYLNQYKAADEVSKDITKRLISQEERLAADMRGFL